MSLQSNGRRWVVLGLVAFAWGVSGSVTIWASQEPREWQGIPGLERTEGGRVFATWYSGGSREPDPENTVLLSISDDGGESYSEPVEMAGPRDGARAYDPTLWIDPKGRLWLIYNRADKEKSIFMTFMPDAAMIRTRANCSGATSSGSGSMRPRSASG